MAGPRGTFVSAFFGIFAVSNLNLPYIYPTIAGEGGAGTGPVGGEYPQTCNTL